MASMGTTSVPLAGDLGVSRRLVVEVHTQLTAEGYLVNRPGSGTRVPASTPASCVEGPQRVPCGAAAGSGVPAAAKALRPRPVGADVTDFDVRAQRRSGNKRSRGPG
jgi:DNA-binding transcriptional MocR family regulator